MKLPIVCLYLSLFAPLVLCNILAGPYQTMLLWYAYRLDIKVFGAGSTLMSPGCYDCYFDDYLKYIQRTGPRTPKWTGSTTVGHNLDPDVLSTANELATDGTAGTASRYSNTIEPSKLFGNWAKGASPSFSDVFKAVVDNIQACRQHVNDVGIDDELDGVRRAMVSIHEARNADQAAKIIEGVNEQLKNAGYTWTVETETVTAPDGSTWEKVDTEKTINAHSDATDGLRTSINNYIANFATYSRDNANHALAIQACEGFEGRLLGEPSC